MRDDVSSVQGNVAALSKPSARTIANIKFRPEDVELFDPMLRVSESHKHKISKISRYHPFNWDDGDFPITTNQPSTHGKKDPRRAENERIRAAQKGSTVDPRHVRLQNRLYDYLRKEHGEGNVHYEQDNVVDLAVENPNGSTFYEIKMETTAKRCIRQAMGQLMEYSHYPECRKADKLVVVGDAPPTNEDRLYLEFLRREYRMPISYSCFHWDSCALQEAV